jgi:hypothetical protein
VQAESFTTTPNYQCIESTSKSGVVSYVSNTFSSTGEFASHSALIIFMKLTTLSFATAANTQTMTTYSGAGCTGTVTATSTVALPSSACDGSEYQSYSSQCFVVA